MQYYDTIVKTMISQSALAIYYRAISQLWYHRAISQLWYHTCDITVWYHISGYDIIAKTVISHDPRFQMNVRVCSMVLKLTHGLLNFYASLHDLCWVCTEFTLEPRFSLGKNLGSQNCQLGATCTPPFGIRSTPGTRWYEVTVTVVRTGMSLYVR